MKNDGIDLNNISIKCNLSRDQLKASVADAIVFLLSNSATAKPNTGKQNIDFHKSSPVLRV